MSHNILDLLPDSLAGVFAFAEPRVADSPYPVLVDTRTGMRFCTIPGGSYMQGLTEAHETAARRIVPQPRIDWTRSRPATHRAVAAFLISETPVLTRLFRKHSRTVLTGYQVENDPAQVTHAQATAFADDLGLMLPSEIQWEYACRAGTTTLFIWGDALLPRSDLDKWLNMDLGELSLPGLNSNAFGLFGLFGGEFCREEYAVSHEPAAKKIDGSHVVKGGGAAFWPWQGHQEWVWCVPGIRLPERDLLPGLTTGFRVVCPLASD